MANIIQTFPAGAGGGHTILDSTGTAVAQEKNLKITGLSVTDSPSTESTDLAPAGLNQDSIDDIAAAGLPSTNVVGSGFNYSTSEQIVGRWIDGKPLYQKTLKITTTLDVGDHKFDHGVSNLDTVYSITGIIISRGSNHDEYSTGIVEAQATTQLVNTYWQRSLNKIHIYNNMNYGATTAYITIQYTKTTD